jgi:hypothetical protein
MLLLSSILIVLYVINPHGAVNITMGDVDPSFVFVVEYVGDEWISNELGSV